MVRTSHKIVEVVVFEEHLELIVFLECFQAVAVVSVLGKS